MVICYSEQVVQFWINFFTVSETVPSTHTLVYKMYILFVQEPLIETLVQRREIMRSRKYCRGTDQKFEIYSGYLFYFYVEVCKNNA